MQRCALLNDGIQVSVEIVERLSELRGWEELEQFNQNFDGQLFESGNNHLDYRCWLAVASN